MKFSCDCIVPFYNEELRPIKVIESLLQIKSISKIITVDDGSDNNTTYLELKKKFPQIITIRLENNQGKADAIKEGLKQTSAEFVLLYDGDHTNIKSDEITKAIEKICNNPQINMIILRKMEDETVMVSRYFRHDIIFSGERILKRYDLNQIYKNNFSDYQIEIAINIYMIVNNKNVYWMPSSVNSNNKWVKWGWFEGSKRSLNMFKGFIDYAGWRNFIWQTLFFCRNEAP